jgi:hypothetical protein
LKCEISVVEVGFVQRQICRPDNTPRDAPHTLSVFTYGREFMSKCECD